MQDVGILYRAAQGGVVELDRNNQETGRRIFVNKQMLNGAPFGMKVVVEYLGKDSAGDSYGKIVEVLGEPDNPDVAIRAIMRSFALPEKFPETVLSAVGDLPAALEPAIIDRELKKARVDLRSLSTITIDGEEAKDLDDAIDLVKIAGKGYKLYVHIADVTHYVQLDSDLDREAFKRGNSVYLVDRVIPMYPPKLSNGLGSLNPDQDRLALTVEIDYSLDGKILGEKIYESLIRSKCRSSYVEIESLLSGEPVQEGSPDWLGQMARDMQELNELLRAERHRRGAIDFDFAELAIDLDHEGHPVKIYPKPRLYADGIIESFMIAANEAVARFCDLHGIAVVYRVHDLPDQDKINNIQKLALGLDHPVSFSDPPRPVEVQKFLTSIAGEPYADLLSALVLRSMAKAEYLEKDEGHFGLASKQYCHFTAPIRRYSDSFTHRQIKSFLHKEKGQSRGEAAKVAEHVSVTERVAVDAERASVQQKAVEYYADRIGQVYQGEISGFSESSFFVRLPSGVEGSVFFRTLKAYFHYEPDRLSAVNRTSGTRLSIGQEVEVKLVAVDTNRRFIDLELTKACNLEVSGKGRRKKKLSSGGQSRKTGRRKKKASGHRKKDKPTRSGSKAKRKKARRSKGKGRKFS